MGRRGGVSPPPGLQGKQRKRPEPPRQVLPPTRATRAAARRAPPVHTRPGADSSCGLPPWVGTEKAHGDGDGRGGVGRTFPSFLPLHRRAETPTHPNGPTPSASAAQRHACPGAGERRSAGPAAGGARGGLQRGGERRGQKDRGRCRREDGAEGRGAAGGRTPGRPRAGRGERAPPHLAALLVVKADHHDVQNGPPRGALAAPPGLLHGQPPRARTTTTSTATGGGRVTGDPWISGVSRGAA